MRSLREIIPYTYPVYHTGKCCYVDFGAVDERTGEMRRKRIKLNKIKSKKARRRFAQRLIYELMVKLDAGWNPWREEVEPRRIRDFALDEVCETYLTFLDQQTELSVLRPDTRKSYSSCLKMFRLWASERKPRLETCRQLTRVACVQFLEWLQVERKNSAMTRNNYQRWLGTFCEWMKEHGYIEEKPTEGLKLIPKKKMGEKTRKTIPAEELARLSEYLRERNPHYLLAVYLQFYCFIRPKEVCMLRLRDIRLGEGVIRVPGEVAKNGRTASVTLPRKVIGLMLDLGIMDAPKDWYIFSEGWKPGAAMRRAKAMYDYWIYHVQPDLGWPREYQLYSLKDTGITRLLHRADALTVRDQARHSDISITNIYAQNEGKASEVLRGMDDVL